LFANIRRGEVRAELGDKTHVLRLTLGALAQMEAAFGATDLVALANRFEHGRLSARDLIVIIGLGLRGGGAAITDDEVAALSVEGGLQGYARIAAELLAATFGAEAPREPGAQNPI
jgi:hypothetical protein